MTNNAAYRKIASSTSP